MCLNHPKLVRKQPPYLVNPRRACAARVTVVVFARGSGVFHGTLNPLSSKSIVEHCVFPCLLFGAETWILNSTLLQKLESFQAELAKRILRLPTRTSNNTSLMALQWPSMRARILIMKLCFLLKVVNSDHTEPPRTTVLLEEEGLQGGFE